MKELFIKYELALELKSHGFDNPCLAFYMNTDQEVKFSYFLINEQTEKQATNSFNDSIRDKTIFEIITAPTHQQVLDWFRDKHWIDIVTIPRIGQSGRHRSYTCTICHDKNDGKGVVHELIRDENKKLISWINQQNAIDFAIKKILSESRFFTTE